MRALLLAVALVLSAGCATSRPATDAVGGTTWRLVAIGDDAVPDDAGVTLAFGADGRISGSSGCNQYSGQARRAADGALTVAPLISTLRACAPPEMGVEAAVLPAIQGATRAEVTDGGELVLTGVTPLRFAAPRLQTLSGTVTYRPRIALAPDAVVTVRLLDASLADAPSVTLAEQTVRTDGAQVPVPYVLSYDASRIGPRRRYVVRAEIRGADGALRWTTDTAFPVLTQGAPADGVEVRVVQVD